MITFMAVIPPLEITGIRCHHGNKMEEEITKEGLHLSLVAHQVHNFFRGAQDTSDQISNKF